MLIYQPIEVLMCVLYLVIL